MLAGSAATGTESIAGVVRDGCGGDPEDYEKAIKGYLDPKSPPSGVGEGTRCQDEEYDWEEGESGLREIR